MHVVLYVRRPWAGRKFRRKSTTSTEMSYDLTLFAVNIINDSVATSGYKLSYQLNPVSLIAEERLTRQLQTQTLGLLSLRQCAVLELAVACGPAYGRYW